VDEGSRIQSLDVAKTQVHNKDNGAAKPAEKQPVQVGAPPPRFWSRIPYPVFCGSGFSLRVPCGWLSVASGY
jgi:hypothetical protein